jgi:hypothetical protein
MRPWAAVISSGLRTSSDLQLYFCTHNWRFGACRSSPPAMTRLESVNLGSWHRSCQGSLLLGSRSRRHLVHFFVSACSSSADGTSDGSVDEFFERSCDRLHVTLCHCCSCWEGDNTHPVTRTAADWSMDGARTLLHTPGINPENDCTFSRSYGRSSVDIPTCDDWPELDAFVVSLCPSDMISHVVYLSRFGL